VGGRNFPHVCLKDLKRLLVVVVCSWPPAHGEEGPVFARRRLGEVGRGRRDAVSGPSLRVLGRIGDVVGRTGKVQAKGLT